MWLDPQSAVFTGMTTSPGKGKEKVQLSSWNGGPATQWQLGCKDPSQRTAAALKMTVSSLPRTKHSLRDAFPVLHTSVFLHLLKARALYPLSQQVLSAGPSAHYCSLPDN